MSDQRKKSDKSRLDRVEAMYEEVFDSSQITKSGDTRKGTTSSVWNEGPDQICPASSFIAVGLTDAVKLRMTNNDYTDYKPISIYSIFKKTVQEKGSHPALGIVSERERENKNNPINTLKSIYLLLSIQSR